MSCQVSLVVPTINEAANLPVLLGRIKSAMSGRSYEVIVVDDASRDGTPEVCQRLSGYHPLTLHVRQNPVGGLSGAVLEGFALARAEILVVMDGDLQHPPESLPAVLAPLLAGDADFVIGSRHVEGGRIVGPWGLARRLNSWIARLLAAPLIGMVRDPMSGFFAIRRGTWRECRGLNPMGYKIGLELMCRCPIARIVEVPIEFGTRANGSSKLTIVQRINYLRQLGGLYKSMIKSPAGQRRRSVEDY